MSTSSGLRANFSCYFRKIDFKLKLFLRSNISGDNAQDAECVAICSVLNKKEILNHNFIFSNHRNDTTPDITGSGMYLMYLLSDCSNLGLNQFTLEWSLDQMAYI